MNRITLFSHKNSGISISMVLYFNEKDQLVFEGYDIGPTTEDFLGDSDYEYGFTIEPEEVRKLYKLLDVKTGDRGALLQEMKKRFAGNHAYSQLTEFLGENGIDFLSSSWV
jgi:hypothetical protein